MPWTLVKSTNFSFTHRAYSKTVSGVFWLFVKWKRIKWRREKTVHETNLWFFSTRGSISRSFNSGPDYSWHSHLKIHKSNKKKTANAWKVSFLNPFRQYDMQKSSELNWFSHSRDGTMPWWGRAKWQQRNEKKKKKFKKRNLITSKKAQKGHYKEKYSRAKCTRMIKARWRFPLNGRPFSDRKLRI